MSSSSAAWQGLPTVVYPTAAQWADSVANVPLTIGGLSFPAVSIHGRLLLNVPAGTKSITVWLANTLINSVFFFDGSVGVYVDGVFNTSLNAVGASSVIQAYVVTLDGSPHTVEIWSGYQQLGSTALTFLGTYVYAVQGVGISLASPPAATRRTAFYGDSISAGGASTPNPQDCYFALLRGVLPAGMALSQEAAGARSLWDDSGSGSGQQGFATQAAWAARMAALVAGATTREVVMMIGYNDINANRWGSSAAFATAWGTALDAIHTTDSGIHVYGVSMINASIDFSATRALMVTQAASRSSFVTYVDGTTLMQASGLSGDGTHPSNVGHQAIALGTGSSAGTSSIRTVLGI